MTEQTILPAGETITYSFFTITNTGGHTYQHPTYVILVSPPNGKYQWRTSSKFSNRQRTPAFWEHTLCSSPTLIQEVVRIRRGTVHHRGADVTIYRMNSN
jgi:hypothetical protein